MRARRGMRLAVTGLAFAGLALTATGCERARSGGAAGPPASVAPTASVTATSSELEGVERYLSAIESELASLTVPSDEDFRAAEDALF